MESFLFKLFDPADRVGGIINGVLAFCVLEAVKRYWSYRSAKSMQKQLKGIEFQKTLTENLAKSEHLTLLFCFGSLFWLMAFVSLAFIIPGLFSILASEKVHVLNTINLAIWICFCVISFAASRLLKRAEKYPESMEGFDKKIAKLTTKLSKPTSKS